MTAAKTLTRDDLRALILAWLDGRRRVLNAVTREKYLTASADLWDAEWALDEAAGRLEREQG